MKHRTSAAQRNILAVLLMLEQANQPMPVPSRKIQELINKSRITEFQPHAFRGGIHKLGDRGLLEVNLNKSAKLFIKLTPMGREFAAPILESMKQ